jgi:hypothetical protein
VPLKYGKYLFQIIMIKKEEIKGIVEKDLGKNKIIIT